MGYARWALSAKSDFPDMQPGSSKSPNDPLAMASRQFTDIRDPATHKDWIETDAITKAWKMGVSPVTLRLEDYKANIYKQDVVPKEYKKCLEFVKRKDNVNNWKYVREVED